MTTHSPSAVVNKFPDAALLTQNTNEGTPVVVSATVNAAPPINGESCAGHSCRKVKLAVVTGPPP